MTQAIFSVHDSGYFTAPYELSDRISQLTKRGIERLAQEAEQYAGVKTLHIDGYQVVVLDDQVVVNLLAHVEY